MPRKPIVISCLVDASGSMRGQKNAALNELFREWIADLQRHLPPGAATVRVIRFADRAEWLVGPIPIPLDGWRWPGLVVGGDTATADALRLLSRQLRSETDDFAVVCLIVTDGYCSQPYRDYLVAIEDFRKAIGKRLCLRVALILGEESDCADEGLLAFLGGQGKLYQPDQFEQLTRAMEQLVEQCGFPIRRRL